MAIVRDFGSEDERLNGRHVCQRQDCIDCLQSPETATMHWDCFRILDTFNIPRDMLWTALAWRLSLRRPLISPRQGSAPPSSVYTIADRLGIPLRRLLLSWSISFATIPSMQNSGVIAQSPIWGWNYPTFRCTQWPNHQDPLRHSLDGNVDRL